MLFRNSLWRWSIVSVLLNCSGYSLKWVYVNVECCVSSESTTSAVRASVRALLHYSLSVDELRGVVSVDDGTTAECVCAVKLEETVIKPNNSQLC